MAAINKSLSDVELIDKFHELEKITHDLKKAMDGIFRGTTQNTYCTSFVQSVLESISEELGRRQIGEHQ